MALGKGTQHTKEPRRLPRQSSSGLCKDKTEAGCCPPERAPEAGRSLWEQEVSGDLLEGTSKDSENQGVFVPLPGSSGNTGQAVHMRVLCLEKQQR